MKTLFVFMAIVLGLASCCDRCKASQSQHPLIQKLNEDYQTHNWDERRKATMGLLVKNPRLEDELIQNFNEWAEGVWSIYKGAKDDRKLLCHVNYGTEAIYIPTKDDSPKNPQHQKVHVRNLRPICVTFRPPRFPPPPEDPPPSTETNAGRG